MVIVVLVLRIILWLSLSRIINKTMTHYGLDAQYERLSLSLLNGDAEIWHLVLVPTDTQIPLTDIEYCRADVSLMTLFTRRLVIPRLEIDGIDVDLTRAEDGTFPQLQTLREVLRKRRDAAQQAAVRKTEIPALPHKIDLTPPFKMDALRLQHVQVRFQDKTVAPVFETRLDLNIRLSDLRSDKRKTRFQVILSSPPVLDQFLVEGTGSSDGKELLAEVKVALQGLHPDTVKDYLADLGVVPDARNLALIWSGSARVQERQVELNKDNSQEQQSSPAGEIATESLFPTLQVHLESKSAALTIDGMEHFALEHASVDAELPNSGEVRVGKIQVRRGAVHAWRRDSGALSVGGFQFVGRPRRKPTVAPDQTGVSNAGVPDSAGVPPSADKPRKAWSLDGVEVSDVRMVLHDQSLSPQSDFVLDLKEATVASVPSKSQGMAMTARLSAPGIMETFQVGGTVFLSSSESNASLKLSGTGIRPDALRPHMKRLGIESLYKGGAFQCDVTAAFGRSKGGPLEGSASVTNISVQDTDELFGLKAIGVQGVKIDPHAGTTHIDQVEISGQRLAVGRDATGCLTVLGLRFSGSPSQPESGQADPSTQSSVSKTLASDTVPSAKDAAAGGPTTRIEIGRLSWRDNALTFVDQMVKPAKTIAVPDLGFELTDLVLGGEGNSALPASLKAWLCSPGTLERAELSGTVRPQPNGLSFDLRFGSEGVVLTEMAPYLQALGVEATMTKGSIGARMKGQMTWPAQGIRCSATIRDVAVKDDDVELAGFNQMDIAQLDLAETGLRVAGVTIEQPRLALSREQSGALSCVGLNTVPGRKTGSETPSKATKSKPAMPVRVDRFQVKDAKIQWSDHAVVPSVSQAVATDITLTDFSLGVEAPPATVAVTIRAPGMIPQARISGQVQITPSKQGADLKLEASGIDAKPLLSYLPKGLEPALQQGQLNAKMITDLTRHPDGGQRIRVRIADMDCRGNSRPEPLLRFDSAELAVDRFDPDAKQISIRQVSVQGLETTVDRKASGRICLLGLDMGTSEPVSPVNPSAADNKPIGQNGAVRKAPSYPLVVLERLSLQASKLTLKDEIRPTATPIVISDLRIGNAESIKVLGDDPEANPPVKIDIQGRIQPLTESLKVKLEVSPFIAQPLILAEWDIAQIRGSGLMAILPELGSAMDAENLRNGRFSGNAQLTLHLERRDVAEFDFSKPFGMDLSIKSAQFSDTETQKVLASVEELRTVIPTLDTRNGIVDVKEISVLNPQGVVTRQTDGLHVMGFTLKTSSAEPVADANAVPPPPATGVHGALARRVENSQGQGKPLNLRVDQFLVNGVDFSFTDQTVDPPMYVPLKGLDVEVRGFTTPGVETREPMRFNVVATAGQVPLPRTNRDTEVAAAERAEDLAPNRPQSSTADNRLLFQEMTATGRLTLYPRPDGWVKAGLSGLELTNFKGMASQKGMTLRDGTLDGSVDLRFHKDQALSTRTQLVFTDLSLTEPPDGFLAQLLTLPVSLDTVLFILSDADGSIHVPLSFKVDQDGVSRGQIVQAAVGAAADLIANAVAGSPFRIAGTIGNLVGGEKEAGGAETHLVQYAAGVTTLSEKQTGELAKIVERLRRQKDLSVTVRHQLGGGDIEKANRLVNPSSTESRELLAKLRQNRSQLRQLRDELAGQTRVAYAAGLRETDIGKTIRLRETEVQLGLVERALDDLLETMRPGSESTAKRRTRDACIAIGRARIETLFAVLADEQIPNGTGRIMFVPPRFSETDGVAGGTVTLTLSKNKAR